MSSSSEQVKCSRTAKHEVSHGETNQEKTESAVNGTTVNGNTDEGVHQSSKDSISGSRQSLRSAGGKESISGSRTSLRSGGGGGKDSVSGSRTSLPSGGDKDSVSGSRTSLRSERGAKNSVSGSRTSLRLGGDAEQSQTPYEDAVSRTDSLRSSSLGDGEGSQRSGSRASSARPQRPKTSFRPRSAARQSSATGSPDRSSLTSRQSYNNDDFDVASLTDAHDFSQYVDVVRQESSRLSMRDESDSDPVPLDVSLLHSVLGDLSLSLKDSEARSLRIYEEIEEVRVATIELKKTLVIRMGQDEDEETESQQTDGKP